MQIQFSDEQVRALRALANERGDSIAAVVREAVDAALARNRRDADWERALAAVGRFRGPGGRASEDHDRYLADALSE